MVECRSVKREGEQGSVADQIAEARARQARCALHVEAADLRVLASLRQLRQVARAGELDRVLLRDPVRHRLVRRVRHLCEQFVAGRSAAAYSSSAACNSSFTCCSSASCSGEGLPFSFVWPRSSSICGTSALQRSSASSSASKASAAPLRASAAR